jgi:hypothetical protein
MCRDLNGRRLVRAGLGVLLILGMHGASFPDAHAERITRGGRCTGELDSVALRGAVRLEHLAETGWETMSGNFRARGSRMQFDAYLHDGVGTGRMWETLGQKDPTNIEVTLRSGGFALRTGQGSIARFECQGL